VHKLDISRMTTDQIEAARKADQEFFIAKRKLSPVFPSAIDVDERRKRLFEAIVARTLLVLSAASVIIAPFSHDWQWYLGDAIGFFLAFLIVCLYAGNRQYVRNGGDSSDTAA
jgi:hypothetical protein